MSTSNNSKHDHDNRREFIRGSSLLLASALPRQSAVATELRLGLIGCGRSGQKLATAALGLSAKESGFVKLVAMADVSPHSLQQCFRGLKGGASGSRCDVRPSARFVGASAYRKMLESNKELQLDAVIIATPVNLRASIANSAARLGLNAYLEQPIARDAGDINRFVDALAVADATSSALAIGNRFDLKHRLLPVCDRLHDGIIGLPQALHVDLPRLPAVSTDARERAQGNSLDKHRAQHSETDFESEGRLQIHTAVLALAQDLFGPHFLPTLASVTCRPAEAQSFVTQDGQSMHVSPNGSGSISAIPTLRLRCSNGSCDLTHGRFWDTRNRLISQEAPAPYQRAYDLEKFLTDLALGQFESTAFHATELTYHALTHAT